MSPPPAKTPEKKPSLGIHNRLRAVLDMGNRYYVHRDLERRLWPFVGKWFSKGLSRDVRRDLSRYTFSDAQSSDLEEVVDDFLNTLLLDLTKKADWSDLHRIVFDEREAQRKKVTDLNSAVGALTKSNEESVARAVAAEGVVAKLGADLRQEQQNAQRVQTELEAKATELAAGRDGLKASLDESKVEIGHLRETLHAEAGALRTIAKELGFNDQEVQKYEEEGKLFAAVRKHIQYLATVDGELEQSYVRQDALHDVLEQSGLYPVNADPATWRNQMDSEQVHAFFIYTAKKLVETWAKHRPERQAVRALSEEQRRILADDQAHLTRKLRPLHPLRADLLRALGATPDGFVESGALGYRNDFDRRLGGDAIDWERFDSFVETLPRLRLNSKIDSWSKLSKGAHVHKVTLRKYADFVDLSRWLPKTQDQPQKNGGEQELG